MDFVELKGVLVAGRMVGAIILKVIVLLYATIIHGVLK